MLVAALSVAVAAESDSVGRIVGIAFVASWLSTSRCLFQSREARSDTTSPTCVSSTIERVAIWLPEGDRSPRDKNAARSLLVPHHGGDFTSSGSPRPVDRIDRPDSRSVQSKPRSLRCRKDGTPGYVQSVAYTTYLGDSFLFVLHLCTDGAGGSRIGVSRMFRLREVLAGRRFN